MKTAIIYYSYTGKTKQWAEKKARKLKADLIEVGEEKKRSTVNAYVLGSLAARRQRKSNITALSCNLSAYDKIIIAAPIWAGYPAPPFNNIVGLLPSGKEVELIMLSGSGNSQSSAEQTKELIQKSGCKVIGYLDIKA